MPVRTAPRRNIAAQSPSCRRCGIRRACGPARTTIGDGWPFRGKLLRCCVVELRKLCIERYKGYAQRAEVELAPLTILVGPNNSGKTALAQTIQLLAGGLAPGDKDGSEPLPLESGGIQHGDRFADLVTGRSAHGWLRLSASLVDRTSNLSLSATVRNVAAPPRPSARQISHWHLTSDGKEIELQSTGFDEPSEYDISISGAAPQRRRLLWRGLIPLQTNDLANWAEARVDALRSWGLGVRHLRCPRRLVSSPFLTPENAPPVLGPDGQDAPLVLAANHDLRASVRKWYRNAFGDTIDIVAQGIYSELVVGASAHDARVPLAQSGRGLSHVLPVVVMALTARAAGPGVDVIEHPEAELHPAAHAHVAELLLDNLAGPVRPLVVETHSEMVLLRARRWVAEKRLPADNVLIYWVQAEPGSGSVLRKISITDKGELDGWPDGVFTEGYEEILAIRRAARANGQGDELTPEDACRLAEEPL